MKKLMRKLGVVVLSVLMCCSVLLGIGSKIDWTILTARADDFLADYV